MAKVITTELQHSGASGANVTLDSSKNVTCENNLQVDGNVTVTGTLPADKLTGALPAISGASLTGISSPLSFRNLIVNGSMQVGQRMDSSNTGGLNLDGVKTVDRFALYTGGTDNACTQHHVDVAAGTTPYTLGFRKKYQITNGNQTSGAGSGDSVEVQTILEGQDICTSGWNATDTNSKLTISYWAKSSVAQTFYFRFRVFASSEYEYTYSVALSANTWTKVTKTIPGNSNFSSLVNTNAKGLFHSWALFNGTDQTNNKTLDAWAVKDNANKSPDCTSTWYTTNDATFELTGVQLEVGDTATTFEHKSYGDELARCKRYYHRRTGHMMMAPYKVMDSPDMGRKFSIFFNEMRVAPTVSGITHTTNGSTTVSVDNAYVDHIEFESGDVSDSTYVRIDTYAADSEL